VISISLAWTIFNISLLHFIYPFLYSQNPVAKTIEEVKKHPAVFSYMIYNPGYNFYLHKPVNKFFDVASLSAALAANPNAVIITRTENEGDLQALPIEKIAEHHDLFELPTTALYVTKKP
jgi:hypothetical protein